MKTPLLFLGVACLLATLPSHAQTVTVRDQTTLQPLVGVVVYRVASGHALSTDAGGEADLSAFRKADTLFFRMTGYQPRKIALRSLAAQQYRVTLIEKSYSLEEVVVSASKFEEKRADVPQQIQVLNASKLAFINQPTTADALQQSGNVLVQKSQQGGGSPIIRGFEANKVLLVVDGVRLNNAIYRGGHLQNVLTLDNTILDKAEIVFGPGSVVYGSDALGGVVHFYTRDPALADSAGRVNWQANAFVRHATANGEKSGHADVNAGFRRWGLLSSFTYSDFGDLRQGNQRNADVGNLGRRDFVVEPADGKDSVRAPADPNVQAPSGYRQYDFLQKILYRPNSSVFHGLNFQYSTSSDVPRYDRLTDLRNGKPSSAEWYYGPQKRVLASYKLDWTARRSLYDRVRILAAYQNVGESRVNRNFGSSNRNHRIENLDVFSLNADLSKGVGRHELRYGLEFTRNQVVSTAFIRNTVTGARSSLNTRYPDGGNTMQTLAGYFTHTWEVSPRWILTDGVRYSNVRLQSDFTEKAFFPFPFDKVTQRNGAVNGNVGAVFQPGRDWRLTGVVSSGFRAPNVDDVGKVFDSQPGNLIVPNPDLKPEYTYNGEIGLSKVLAGRVRIEATGYYTRYRGAIAVRPFTLNGQDTVVYAGIRSRVTANVNATQAYLYGFSAALATDITPFLSLTSTLNYTYGRIRTDSTNYPLDHIPPLFGRTSVVVNLRGFRGEMFAVYNGWKRLKNYSVVGEDNLQYAVPPTGMPGWQRSCQPSPPPH